MRKKISISLVCFCLGLTSFAQIQTFSLAEAKTYALANSDKIKNSNLDLEIANEQVKETRSIGLPQINGSGSFNNFFNLPVQVVSANFMNPNADPNSLVAFKAGTDFSVSGNIQATQLIFSGSYLVGLQVSKFYTEFSASNIEKTKEEVLFQVIQAYQTLVAAKSNIKFIDSMVNVTQSLVDKQQNFLDLGLITQEEMDQLNYALSTAKNNLLSAKLQVKNANSLLKLTMGFPQEEELEISETIETILSPKSISKEPFSPQNNTTYQLLFQQKALNEYALKEVKFSSLPSLSAVFQHGYNAYRNEFNFFSSDPWYSQTFWGLQLKVPIFSSGNSKANLNQAKIEIKKNENTIHEFEQTLIFQENQAQNNLQIAQEQLKLASENIALAQGIYENAVIKEQVGKINSILVTQKYNQLIQAQANYINAVMAVFNATLQLDQLHNQLSK
jgi:outer membrane protein